MATSEGNGFLDDLEGKLDYVVNENETVNLLLTAGPSIYFDSLLA